MNQPNPGILNVSLPVSYLFVEELMIRTMQGLKNEE